MICRSGGRSAQAVDLLAEAGFKNAYSVIDGMGWDLDLTEHADMRRLGLAVEAAVLAANGLGDAQ